MTEPPRKKLFPNPFYVLLLAASTLFVLTVLAYLVIATVLQQPAGRPAGPRWASDLAGWVDRRGPLALAAEFVVMLASGLLAMATDRWFSPTTAKKNATPV